MPPIDSLRAMAPARKKHRLSNQAHFKITSSAPFGGEGGSQVKKRGGKGDAERGTGGEGTDRRDRWGSESEGTRWKGRERGGGEKTYKTQRNIFETGSPQRHRSTEEKLDRPVIYLAPRAFSLHLS